MSSGAALSPTLRNCACMRFSKRSRAETFDPDRSGAQRVRVALDVGMTSASPSMTTLPATVQTVVKATRRFSGNISLTVTVACTVSPGRTGALKRRFCPR